LTVDCSQNVSISGYHYGQNLATDYISWALAYVTNSTKSNYQWYQKDTCNLSNYLLANSSQNLLTRLGNADCINAYGPGNKRLSKWGNVIAVAKEQPPNSNNTILYDFRHEMYVSNYTGNSWACSNEYLIANNYDCKYNDLAANSSSWTLGPINSSDADPWRLVPSSGQYPIDYCWSKPTDLGGMCQLQYSLIIMICVLIANAFKFPCIVFVLSTHFEPVLATIGDGIASFLEIPDKWTAKRPFLNRNQARKYRLAWEQTPGQWQSPKWKLRWWHASSRPRWIITLTL
jgi:hypothetical protein